MIFSFLVYLLIFLFFSIKAFWVCLSPIKLLLLLAIAMPFTVNVNLGVFTISIPQIITILFLINCIFYIITHKISISFGYSVYLFILVTLFGISCSIFYSSQVNNMIRCFVQSSKILIYLLASIFSIVLFRKNIGLLKEFLCQIQKGIFVYSIIGIVVFFSSMVIGADTLPTIRDFNLTSLPQSLTYNQITGTSLFRAHSMGEPKALAAWAVIGIIITLYFLLSQGKKSIFFKKQTIYLFIFLTAVFLSFSRSGLIEIVTVFIIYIMFRNVIRKIGIKYILSIFLIIIIALVYINFFSTLPIWIRQSIAEVSVPLDVLLEDYDYAVFVYYQNNPSSILLPKGIAYIEEQSRPFIPSRAPWAFNSKFSIRRGFILSLIEFGLIGSVIIFFILLSFGLRLWKKNNYSELFFLVAWLAFFSMQVEDILLFHIMMFGVLYMLANYSKNYIFGSASINEVVE